MRDGMHAARALAAAAGAAAGAASASGRPETAPLCPAVCQVKKKFIDKKNATTYNLVFRSTEVRCVHRLSLCLSHCRRSVARPAASMPADVHSAPHCTHPCPTGCG